MSYFQPARTMCIGMLIAIGSSPMARADAPAPASYAASLAPYSHALPLTVTGKEALVQLRLPKDVYLNSRSTALNDLRLFDRSGISVPFALTLPETQALVSVRLLPVAIFPLLAADRGGNANPGLDIRTSADGTLVSVNTRAVSSAAAPARLSALVLDMRASASDGTAAPPQISALRLTLPQDISNYTARIELEVSDDLKQWDSLGESVISWMTNADTKALANDRFEFDARSFRYARISWREGTPVTFAAIGAEERSQTDVLPIMDSITLAPQPGKFAGDLVYRSAVAIPVRALGLQFSQQNVVAPAVMGRYVQLPSIKKGGANRWDFEPAFSATFYKITQPGRTRTSGEIAFRDTHFDQWVLRPMTALTTQPSLHIAWQPASMVFLANGNGPYTVAVGSAGARAAHVDISLVAPGFTKRELASLEQAVAGPIQQQGEVSATPSVADAAGSSAQQRLAILWAVLVLGVIVLGFMAKVLLGQMRAERVESGG